MGEIPGDGGRGRESVSQNFLMVNVDSSIEAFEHRESVIQNYLNVQWSYDTGLGKSWLDKKVSVSILKILEYPVTSGQ